LVIVVEEVKVAIVLKLPLAVGGQVPLFSPTELLTTDQLKVAPIAFTIEGRYAVPFAEYV
jgi:hypothetical protein